jgi:hypothetical protein
VVTRQVPPGGDDDDSVAELCRSWVQGDDGRSCVGWWVVGGKVRKIPQSPTSPVSSFSSSSSSCSSLSSSLSSSSSLPSPGEVSPLASTDVAPTLCDLCDQGRVWRFACNDRFERTFYSAQEAEERSSSRNVLGSFLFGRSVTLLCDVQEFENLGILVHTDSNGGAY